MKNLLLRVQSGSLISSMALGFLLLNSGHAAAANLLANAGFETGDFSGWSVGGNSVSTGVDTDGTLIGGTDGPFTPASVNVRSGDFAGFALVQNGIAPVERIILTQTIDVLQNQTVDVGFYLGNDSQSSFGMNIDDNHTQIFIDGVGLLPNGSQSIPDGDSPSDFSLISGSFNTGSRDSITVSYAINGSGNSKAGVSFDDFFFDTVAPPPASTPEPSTLLGLGTLALAGGSLLRRKRNA